MSNLEVQHFQYLSQQGNDYKVNRKNEWSTDSILYKEDIIKCMNFSYNMAFKPKGHHRNSRTNSSVKRSDENIFTDALRGKFAEFGFYNYMKMKGYPISPPNIDVYGKGKWDNGDFEIGESTISIKSTKEKGHLLLLEENDYDLNGIYKPNIGRDDKLTSEYIFLVKVESKFLNEFYKKKLDSPEKILQSILQSIDSDSVKINIAGYITHDDFVNKIIGKNYILPKDAMLYGRIKMQVSNYYVQAGDLRDIIKEPIKY